jgi:hypothetical protein
VHVAQLPQRAEQLDLGDREPGVAEQRQPRREVQPVAAAAEAVERVGVPKVRGPLADACDQAAPQLGLPHQVLVHGVARTVGVRPLAPVGDQPGPLHGVRREEAGEPPCHRVAPGPAQGSLVARDPEAEVGGQRLAPRLAHRLVDDLEQGPHHAVGVPGVVALLAEQHRDQRVRREEADPGADPVAAPRPDAQPVGEPLGEPALHPAGGHHHDLLGEGILQRCRQEVPQAVREEVCALGAMDPQCHAMQDVTAHRQCR